MSVTAVLVHQGQAAAQGAPVSQASTGSFWSRHKVSILTVGGAVVGGAVGAVLVATGVIVVALPIIAAIAWAASCGVVGGGIVGLGIGLTDLRKNMPFPETKFAPELAARLREQQQQPVERLSSGSRESSQPIGPGSLSGPPSPHSMSNEEVEKPSFCFDKPLDVDDLPPPVLKKRQEAFESKEEHEVSSHVENSQNPVASSQVKPKDVSAGSKAKKRHVKIADKNKPILPRTTEFSPFSIPAFWGDDEDVSDVSLPVSVKPSMLPGRAWDSALPATEPSKPQEFSSSEKFIGPKRVIGPKGLPERYRGFKFEGFVPTQAELEKQEKLDDLNAKIHAQETEERTAKANGKPFKGRVSRVETYREPTNTSVRATSTARPRALPALSSVEEHSRMANYQHTIEDLGNMSQNVGFKLELDENYGQS